MIGKIVDGSPNIPKGVKNNYDLIDRNRPLSTRAKVLTIGAALAITVATDLLIDKYFPMPESFYEKAPITETYNQGK